LAASTSGGEVTKIRVAQGVYKPDQGTGRPPGSRAATFRLQTGVALRGGYAGCGEPDPDRREFVSYETILSGDLADNDLPGFQNISDNAGHVVTATDVDETAVLDGFTVRDGNADFATLLASSGGGISITTASPTIANCRLENNRARSSGGGVYCDQGLPTFTDVTFAGNYSENRGAGFYSKASGPLLIRCHFLDNACRLTGANGGGMYTTGSSTPVLVRCAFARNTATNGAGIYSSVSTPIVLDSLFEENVAALGSGGMHCIDSAAVIEHCRFSANQARWAGAISIQGGDPPSRIVGCVFDGNIAENSAGAIGITGPACLIQGCDFLRNSVLDLHGGGAIGAEADLNVVECNFIRNSGPSGGAMFINQSANLSISKCRFVGNHAFSHFGGAIYARQSGVQVSNSLFNENVSDFAGGAVHAVFGSEVHLTNSTFVHNFALVGSAISTGANASYPPNVIRVANGILWDGGNELSIEAADACVVTYSNVQGGRPGTGNIDLDPLFFDHDGMDDLPGTEDDDLRLSADSPCVNLGDPAAPGALAETDLDGEPRIRGCRVDMGSFETSVESVPFDFSSDGRVDLIDVARFYECFANAAAAPSRIDACLCVFDANEDETVDLADVAALGSALTGP
jgi:predicted outer membrane repeat protein